MALIDHFPFYPGLSRGDMLNVCLALGGETRRWRVKAGEAKTIEEGEVCDRVADEYFALWGRMSDMMSHADYDPNEFEGDDLREAAQVAIAR